MLCAILIWNYRHDYRDASRRKEQKQIYEWKIPVPPLINAKTSRKRRAEESSTACTCIATHRSQYKLQIMNPRNINLTIGQPHIGTTPVRLEFFTNGNF